MNGVITDINQRWLNGTDHHPKSKIIFNAIKDNDWKYGNDYFCWKYGGDGDNGEHLMYLLDIYFETEDRKMTMPELITDILNEN